MQVELEEVSPVLAKLKITVPAGVVEDASKKLLAAYTKKAKIPGFRPGKAPANIIERHFGKEMHEELLERVIPDHCFMALRQQGVVPVDTPRIADVDYEKGEELSFTAMVEKRPSIELQPYTGIKAKKEPVVVTDEDVEMTLEGIRDKMAEYEAAPEGYMIGKGDYVLVNCIASIDGAFIEGSEIKGYPLKAGHPTFPEGLGEQLVGAKKGDMLAIQGVVPPGVGGEDQAGKPCLYQAEITDVQKIILPAMDEKFVKSVSKEETVDALKDKIREDVRRGKERDQDLKVKYQVMKTVCDMYSFDVPPTLVERELLRMIQRALPERNWQEQPLTQEEFNAFAEAKTPEAVESVRGRMVLEEIAMKENITVTDGEVERELHGIAASSGESLENVRKYYAAQYGSIEGFRGILALDKTMDFLASKADIE